MTNVRLKSPGHKPYVMFIVALLLWPTTLWLNSTGNIMDYWLSNVPKGQGLYVLSKLMGLYAIMLLSVQILVGLSKTRRFFVLHRLVGISLIIAVLSHCFLFIAAVSLRSGAINFSILLPDFNSGFYTTALSLGVVSMWLLMLVSIAGVYRSMQHQSWVWMHRLSIVVCVLTFVHSYWIGSETRSVALTIFYNTALVLIVISLCYRLVNHYRINI